ncbi:RidA family protein [Cupriavidus sp. L7L]|uniref:RidA family protein n=1 Tax=Cupriavidus sp. L7L TaxID=2546443 RepID=UPI001055AB6F|nr:RidA family protein [Cupriavidus sp. L7L]TDF62663.1 RidA family protein [Cupriavidus sp. L7L]
MVEVIDTGLKPIAQPFSWATRANGIIFTAHGPVDSTGTIAGDDIAQQAHLTFSNLQQAVVASGSSLTDVAQVLIYLKEASHMASVDDVYRRFFSAPYPNRSSVVVKDFVHPAMLIEIVAYVASKDH